MQSAGFWAPKVNITCMGNNLKLTTNIDKDAMKVPQSDHKDQH